jgi:hypothetical protein
MAHTIIYTKELKQNLNNVSRFEMLIAQQFSAATNSLLIVLRRSVRVKNVCTQRSLVVRRLALNYSNQNCLSLEAN